MTEDIEQQKKAAEDGVEAVVAGENSAEGAKAVSADGVPRIIQQGAHGKNVPGAFHSQDIPMSPGVYVYRNTAGEVIYVGKARNLRNRMRSYFMPSTAQRSDPRRRALIHSIASYEYYTVASESEALLLETHFIKEYAPKYNVLMRDDKRYQYVCADLTETYPHFTYSRLRLDDNRLYFGPFPQAAALHEVIHFLEVHFGLRSCDCRQPDEETRRHCLKHILCDCTSPCIGQISREDYAARFDQAVNVLHGDTIARDLFEELTKKMQDASAQLDFEAAAKFRDMMSDLKVILEPSRRFTNQTIANRRHPQDNQEGMEALAQVLGLETLPRHMECFDMSNISGTLAVGSMVCFRNGRPATSEYRRYKIKNQDAHDDTAFMREVLTRRYTRLIREKLPLPDLIVLDGGRPQVNMAIGAFADIDMPPVPFIGLAERYEQIVIPGINELMDLPHDHPALRLLQSIRDEAHRWANGYNRELRNKRIQFSVLTDIPGIGSKRREELLKTFGSVRRIADLSPEQLAEKFNGLGIKTAERIITYLKEHLT